MPAGYLCLHAVRIKNCNRSVPLSRPRAKGANGSAIGNRHYYFFGLGNRPIK